MQQETLELILALILGKDPAPFSGLQILPPNNSVFAFFKGCSLSETLIPILLQNATGLLLPSTLQREVSSCFTESQRALHQLEDGEFLHSVTTASLPRTDTKLRHGLTFFLAYTWWNGLSMHVTGWCHHGHFPWVRMFAMWKHFVYWWFVSQYWGTLENRLLFGPMGLTIHFIPIPQWNKLQEVQLCLESDQTQGAEVSLRLWDSQWAHGRGVPLKGCD